MPLAGLLFRLRLLGVMVVLAMLLPGSCACAILFLYNAVVRLSAK